MKIEASEKNHNVKWQQLICGTFKRICAALFFVIMIISLTIIIPLFINEAYKRDGLYETVWGAQDALSYYGNTLNAAVTAITVFITIKLTFKQLKRERYLEKRLSRLEKLDDIIMQALAAVSPMKIFGISITDNDGLSYIKYWRNQLIDYNINIELALSTVESYVDLDKEPDVSNYIQNFKAASENYKELANNVEKVLRFEDNPEFNMTEPIDFQSLNKLSSEISEEYSTSYQKLLSEKRKLFEVLYQKADDHADDILSWKKDKYKEN